jgi:hypothetical protein
VAYLQTFKLYNTGAKPERLTWERLYIQFGAAPEKAEDKITVRNFRNNALRELKKLKLAWPALAYATPTVALKLSRARHR